MLELVTSVTVRWPGSFGLRSAVAKSRVVSRQPGDTLPLADVPCDIASAQPAPRLGLIPPGGFFRPAKSHAAVRCRDPRTGDGAEHGKYHAPRHTGQTRACRARYPGADVPAGPHKRVSAKVRRAIDAMVSGKCKLICDAAEHVGLARESLSRALSTPHVAQHLREKVVRHLAIQAARAGYVKGELLDSDNEMVRDRASTFILGLADIAPASAPALSVNLEIKAGYVIDLSDDRPPVRRIPHV